MIQFDLPKEQSSIIKVIGVGGGGSNAVNYMHSLNIEGVDFIVCNTDAQSLAQSKVPNKIQLGPSLTQGLGAGANPEIGKQATEESLEEIRRILEVNTKMAFVTAGMGGGTGTGGAPIIAKICKDMGILTVGIVTTPFSYEGKKRALYADAGIKELKSQVDTLLVISNDKLRHQFGNLTMSAALSTADNVLSTAAKCITDVINTTGQINVDFADVCTVMRNGGVAILGSARAKGEERAQLAIEQALNSPLLNDNDIRGAKWVLININSRPGESEFTMDEVETIQQYLLTQAGPDADVILGLGYDESLGDEISITIIATGFEQKSQYGDKPEIRKEEVKDDRIMFTLDINPEPKKEVISLVPIEEKAIEADIAPIAQVEEKTVLISPVQEQAVVEMPVLVELDSQVEFVNPEQDAIPLMIQEIEEQAEVAEEEGPVVFELDLGVVEDEVVTAVAEVPSFHQEEESTIVKDETEKAVVAAAGLLVKPSVIYVEETPEEIVNIQEPVQTPAPAPVSEIISFVQETENDTQDSIELVFHEEAQLDAEEVKEEIVMETITMEAPSVFDEAEAQKARAAERLHKLRNLSFNFNSSDPNNEYENIPAYVRQNLQVHNTTLASVEKFYSSYAVGTDENNVTQISTINTFLEGKKPD
ncbi:MAG: cell division protein FtsZ [Chitinophagia bacterium]